MNDQLKNELQAKDAEYWLKSKFTAGFVGAVLLVTLSVLRDFSTHYEYATLISAFGEFLAGAYFGERVVFAIVGALLSYVFMGKTCG